MSARVSFESLSQDPMAVEQAKLHKSEHYYSGGKFAWGLLCFIVLVIIIWLILVATKPQWILRDCDKKHGRDVDYGRSILCALVIAIIFAIVVMILWMLVASTSNCYN